MKKQTTDMKKETEALVKSNTERLYDELKELEDEKVITHDESLQIQKRLQADIDYYIQHQDIGFTELEKMFFETIKSFENIKINQSLFSIIQHTFNCLHKAPKTDLLSILTTNNYENNSELGMVMMNWFDNFQNDSDKIADLILRVKRSQAIPPEDEDVYSSKYNHISFSEYDDIISTLTYIKNDTTISKEELKKTLRNEMLKYANVNNGKNNNYKLEEIRGIYGQVSYIKKLGIREELSAIYEENWEKPKELTYAEIKKQVLIEFKIMLKNGFITQQQFDNCTKIIIQDVEFCEKNTDKGKIKAQLLSSLNKMHSTEFDTEDRERIVDWYYILSQKTNVDINNELNKWLYIIDIESAAKVLRFLKSN